MSLCQLLVALPLLLTQFSSAQRYSAGAAELLEPGCAPILLDSLSGGGLVRLEPGCNQLFGQSGVNVYRDLTISGQPDSVLDLAYLVHLLEPQTGVTIVLSNMVLTDATILTQEIIIPGFLDLHHDNVTVYLESLSMNVECTAYQQAEMALGSAATPLANVSNSIYIANYTSDKMVVNSVTLSCDASMATSGVQLLLDDGPQLLANLGTLAQSNTFAVMQITNDVSLRNVTWPRPVPGVPNDMVMNGLWQYAYNRTAVLDLALKPQVMRLVGQEMLTLQNLVLMNVFVMDYSGIHSNAPLLQGAMAMYPFVYPRLSCQLQLLNVTVVMSQTELKSIRYWITLLIGSSQLASAASYWLRPIIGEVNMSDSMDSAIRFGLLRSTSYLWQNVTVTTEDPVGVRPSMPLPNSTIPVRDPILANLPISAVYQASHLLIAASSSAKDAERVTRSSTRLMVPRLALLKSSITLLPDTTQPGQGSTGSDQGPVAMQQPADDGGVIWPAQGVTLFTSFLLSGSSGNQESNSSQPALNLGQVGRLFTLFNSSIQLVLEHVTITNMSQFSPVQGGRPSLPASALFLWPIVFNRAQPQVELQNCTIYTSQWEFQTILAAARAGVRWRSVGGPIISGMTSLMVYSYSDTSIMLSQYEGFGVRGFYVSLVLSPEMDAFADSRLAKEKDIIGTPFPPDKRKAKDFQMGLGIGLPIGFCALLVAFLAAIWKCWRGRNTQAYLPGTPYISKKCGSDTDQCDSRLEDSAAHPRQGMGDGVAKETEFSQLTSMQPPCDLQHIIVAGQQQYEVGVDGSQAQACTAGPGYFSAGQQQQQQQQMALTGGWIAGGQGAGPQAQTATPQLQPAGCVELPPAAAMQEQHGSMRSSWPGREAVSQAATPPAPSNSSQCEPGSQPVVEGSVVSSEARFSTTARSTQAGSGSEASCPSPGPSSAHPAAVPLTLYPPACCPISSGAAAWTAQLPAGAPPCTSLPTSRRQSYAAPSTTSSPTHCSSPRPTTSHATMGPYRLSPSQRAAAAASTARGVLPQPSWPIHALSTYTAHRPVPSPHRAGYDAQGLAGVSTPEAPSSTPSPSRSRQATPLGVPTHMIEAPLSGNFHSTFSSSEHGRWQQQWQQQMQQQTGEQQQQGPGQQVSEQRQQARSAGSPGSRQDLVLHTMSRLGARSQQQSGSWLAAGDLCILHPPVAQQEHHIPSCELRPGPYSADPAGAVQAQTDLQQPSPQAASQQQAAHELHCRGMVAGQAMSEGGCSRPHPAAQHTQQPGHHTASQGGSSSGSSTVMLPPPGSQPQYQRFSNASSAASGAGPNNTTARGGVGQADGEGLLQGSLPPEGQQVWSIPLEYHHPCLHEAPAMAAQQHLPLSRAEPRTGAGSGVLCLSPAGMPHQHQGQEEHAAPALAGALDASAAASLGTMVAGPGSAGQTLQQARRSTVPEDQVQEPALAPAQVLSVRDRGWRADTAGVPAGEPPSASTPGWGSGGEAAHATGGNLDTAGAGAAAGGGTWVACTQQQASGLHLAHQSTPAAMSSSQADGHSAAGAPDFLPPPPVVPSAANGMHGGGAENRRNGAAHAPWDLARATSPAPFPPGTADVQAGQAPTACAAASSPTWAQPRAPTPNPTPVATIQPAAPTAPASWAEAPPAAAPWPRPSAEAVPEPVREIQQLISELRGDRGSELTILHPIGQGGFGTVYKGLWRNLEVAVKTVLFQDKATNGQSAAACHISPAADDAGDLATSALAQQHSQARAVLEAAVTSSIAHPNVVATYHYDIIPVRATEGAGLRGLNITHAAQVDWKLYLVQEFCDAGALSTAFDQRYFHSAAGLPYLEMVLCILQDIARGMAHIHSKSVIHGDLTPTNILLKHDMNRSSRFLAKIADFGLCATITPGKTHISNIRNGTPFYAAPETTASGILSKASDAYSFGVLMWELFTGRVPWEATPTGFMPAKDFKKFPRGTPSGYVSLCLQCLDSNPRARPSFDTALQRLDTLLAKLMQKAAKLQQQHSQGQPQPQVNHSLQPVFGAQQHLQQQLQQQQQQQQQVVQHQYLAPATLPPSLTYLSSPGTVMGPGVPPGLQQNHHCPMPHGSPMAPDTYCSAANVSSPNASGPYAPNAVQ